MTGDFHSVNESAIQWVNNAPAQSGEIMGAGNPRHVRFTEQEAGSTDEDDCAETHEARRTVNRTVQAYEVE